MRWTAYWVATGLTAFVFLSGARPTPPGPPSSWKG